MTLWDGCTNFMSPPAKFVGHRHCDSGDGMFLIFQVISQDHVIKGSCVFMGGSPLSQVTILPSLLPAGTVFV